MVCHGPELVPGDPYAGGAPITVPTSSPQPCSEPAPVLRPKVQLEHATASGYTSGMKTAVSVPDEVFDEAEHLAKRLKISRSELYAKALVEFVSRHAPDTVTESFNRVCSEIQGEPDPAFQRAARKILESSDW